MAKQRGHGRQARAVNLCSHFNGTALAAYAQAGLGALEADHKPIITTAGDVGCGVALDRSRQHAEPNADRWDYVFTSRSSAVGYGVEVHHASPDEALKMIAKKAWAEALLRSECSDLEVVYWLWIAAPPN